MSSSAPQLSQERIDQLHNKSESNVEQSQQQQKDEPPSKQPQPQQPQAPPQKLNNSLITKNKPKLAKCMSIVHLFGNAYSTQQYASRHKDPNMTSNGGMGGGRLAHMGREHQIKSKLERFKHRSVDQIDGKSDSTNGHNNTMDETSTANTTTTATTKPLPIEDFCDDKDLGARAFRTISKVNYITQPILHR